jgi:co-chaperonin GroES (HSP10)
VGLRLQNDSILVKMDPEAELVTSGLLVKPQIAHEHVLRTGKVMQVGPGKWARKGERALNKRVRPDIEEGDGVLFIKFLNMTETNKALQVHLGEDEIILRPDDILLVFDHDDPPEFSQ